jgi:hypothetical protein
MDPFYMALLFLVTRNLPNMEPCNNTQIELREQTSRMLRNALISRRLSTLSNDVQTNNIASKQICQEEKQLLRTRIHHMM